MSLLTRPRHVVEVVNVVQVKDQDGVWESRQTDPITVRCNVHPMSATEAEAYGLSLSDTYAVTARDWPGDENSLVHWDGQVYQQQGRVQKARLGKRTQHDRVVIQRGNDA